MVCTASIADVYVTVLPETAALAAGIKKALRDADSDAREAGRRWAREIEAGLRGIDIEISVDTAKAKAEIEAAAKDQKATVDVDADTAKANAEIDHAARDRKSTIKTDVDRSSLDSAEKAATSLSSALLKVGSSAAFTNIGIAGAIPVIAAVGAAAIQASSALLLLPAALAGIGAGFGVLKIGLSGISDALTAVSGAQQSAAADATAHASAVTSANRSVESATRSMNSAIKSEEQAQKDVARARKDARRELEDINDELRNGAIDETQAQLDLAKAREELATGTFSSLTDYQQAYLNVVKAEQRLGESHKGNARLEQDVADKRAKGVEGSDKVTAANERLATAQENTAASLQSLADAQQQLATAQNQSSSAAQKANAAMAALSPNAQNLVNTLIGLKPVWESFRNSLQDPLTAGLGPMIQNTVNAVLPAVQPGLVRIAGAFNTAFKNIGGWLQDPKNLSTLQTIVDNIATAFERLAPVVAPVLDAFSTIARVGSEFLPGLADKAVTLATKFADFLRDAERSGKLRDWISDGLTALGQLWEIAKNLYTAFKTLYDYLQPKLSWISGELAKHPALVQAIVTAFAGWLSIKGVTSLITSLTTIGNLFGGLGGKAVTAGGEIGKGLISGLGAQGFKLLASGWTLPIAIAVAIAYSITKGDTPNQPPPPGAPGGPGPSASQPGLFDATQWANANPNVAPGTPPPTRTRVPGQKVGDPDYVAHKPGDIVPSNTPGAVPKPGTNEWMIPWLLGETTTTPGTYSQYPTSAPSGSHEPDQGPIVANPPPAPAPPAGPEPAPPAGPAPAAPGGGGAAGLPAAPAVGGDLTTKEGIASYIYQSALANGYSSDEAMAFVAQALGESGLDPAAHNAAGWSGIFQFDEATWKLAGGGDVNDAKTNIDNYFRLAKLRDTKQGSIRERIGKQVSVGGPAFPGNVGSGNWENLLSQATGLVGSQPSTPVSVSGTGTGTPVFVTNWPSALGGAVSPAVPGAPSGAVTAGTQSITQSGVPNAPSVVNAAGLLEQQFPGKKFNFGGSRKPGEVPGDVEIGSQHLTGLALDVGIGNDMALGDQVYAWANKNKEALGIDYILWRVKDHFNHVHISFKPGAPVPTAAQVNSGVADQNQNVNASPIQLPGAIPPGQQKTDKSGKGMGQQLGQDIVSGMLEVFGFGDIFEDPTQFGLFKIGESLLKFGANFAKAAKGTTTTSTSTDTGVPDTGIPIVDSLLSLVPQPYGAVGASAGADAGAPGGVGAAAGLSALLPARPDRARDEKQRAPGGPGDINVNIGHAGANADEVIDQVYDGQAQFWRPTSRALPTK